MPMQLISVNVGRPRLATYRGQVVSTGIFKSPVEGRVALSREQLAGDQQADLSVHGGADKCVYVYTHEHYRFWQDALEHPGWPYGQFGENLTVLGMLESEVSIGDQYRIGSALVQVTQPRVPCLKLAIRMGIPGFPKLFLASLRTGFYLRVIEEGDVGAGDPIELVTRYEHTFTVRDICRVYHDDQVSAAVLREAADSPGLSGVWQAELEQRLAK